MFKRIHLKNSLHKENKSETVNDHFVIYININPYIIHMKLIEWYMSIYISVMKRTKFSCI